MRMNPNLSNKDNYDGDWEEEDVPKRPPTDQMRDRPISASRPPLPHGLFFVFNYFAVSFLNFMIRQGC